MRTSNRLINSLEDADKAALLENTFKVELTYLHTLEEAKRTISNVYFIETGVASVMYRGGPDTTTEVGLIGSEGCTGCAVILGVGKTPQTINVQIPGSALCIPADRLTELMFERPALRLSLLKFVHVLIIQRDETALAANRANIPQRLARWLLMAQDRLHSPDVPLSHELIALMLGVRRAGVTVALNDLKSQGLVSTRRREIRIADRERLVTLASMFYGAPASEYERLFTSEVAAQSLH